MMTLGWTSNAAAPGDTKPRNTRLRWNLLLSMGIDENGMKFAFINFNPLLGNQKPTDLIILR